MLSAKKGRVLLAALAISGAGIAIGASSASAIDGQQFIVDGDFSSLPSPGGQLVVPNTTTDFTPGILGIFGTGNGSMYDPGKYTIASNPNSLHEAWITLPEGNPMLILNGFQSTNQKVWEQTITTSPCTTPGSQVTFDFTANAMNILSDAWVAEHIPGGAGGANIEVKINGVSIGTQDLTSNSPGTLVQFVGSIPAAAAFDVAIWNNGTAYIGNDFAIDNISLIQRGDCAPPCTDVVHGVWFNYTGNYKGVGAPALNDPNWHALPATPNGQHDVDVRGFNKPYQVGNAKGKGDWFKWVDDGTKCAV